MFVREKRNIKQGVISSRHFVSQRANARFTGKERDEPALRVPLKTDIDCGNGESIGREQRGCRKKNEKKKKKKKESKGEPALASSIGESYFRRGIFNFRVRQSEIASGLTAFAGERESAALKMNAVGDKNKTYRAVHIQHRAAKRSAHTLRASRSPRAIFQRWGVIGGGGND